MTKFFPLTMFAMMAAATTAGCTAPGAGTDDEVASTDEALTTSGVRTVSLGGKWVNSAPCTFTKGDPYTPGPFKCDGPTSFTGDMVGSSHYYVTGTILPDFDYAMTFTETFTVKLKNGTSGSFNMVEASFLDAATGKLQINGFIAGGTGAFKNARGNLSFPGVSDANGIGTGTYCGKISY